MIEYTQIDWRDCLLAINATFTVGSAYTGIYASRNQDEYDNQTTWLSGITKPTWAQIIDKWITFNVTGSGVSADPFAPGDRKFSPISTDHGNWLYIDPTNGRTLSRTDYAMLYKIVGDVYNGQYSGIAGTDFGLPKGVGGRVPMYSNPSYAYGSMAGAINQTLSASHLPLHSHSLDSNIVRQTTGLTLFGLGGIVSVNPAGKILPTNTGDAGTASPTAVPILQPYWSAGNLFIFKGKLKYPESLY